MSSNPLDTLSATINILPGRRQRRVPITIRLSAINITTEVQWLGLRFFFFFSAFALFGLLMIGYQIPISLSPLEDCFGEHLEAGWLKGLHSCASVSAFRGTDTRPLPGKEAEPALGGVGWTKRKLELESMRACSAESYFSLLHVPAGRAGRWVGGH